MIVSKHWRLLMPFDHCKASGAVHVTDLIAFLATAAMTLKQSGKACVTAVFCHCSRCGIPSKAVDLVDGDGW